MYELLFFGTGVLLIAASSLLAILCLFCYIGILDWYTDIPKGEHEKDLFNFDLFRRF